MQLPNFTKRAVEEHRPIKLTLHAILVLVELDPGISAAAINYQLLGPFLNPKERSAGLSRVTASLVSLVKSRRVARLKQDGQYRYYLPNHMAVKGVIQTVKGKRPYNKRGVANIRPLASQVATPKPQLIVHHKTPVEELAKEFVWQMTMASTPEKITLSQFVEWAKNQ